MYKKRYWVRASEITKKYPENIYRFKDYLTRPGDYVVTEPISYEALMKLKYAAYAWAWYKGYTIKTSRVPKPDNKWVFTITLVKLHRNRDYA